MKKITLVSKEIERLPTTTSMVYDYLTNNPDSSVAQIKQQIGTYRQVVEQAIQTLTAKGLIKSRTCECGLVRLFSKA